MRVRNLGLLHKGTVVAKGSAVSTVPWAAEYAVRDVLHLLLVLSSDSALFVFGDVGVPIVGTPVLGANVWANVFGTGGTVPWTIEFDSGGRLGHVSGLGFVLFGIATFSPLGDVQIAVVLHALEGTLGDHVGTPVREFAIAP